MMLCIEVLNASQIPMYFEIWDWHSQLLIGLSCWISWIGVLNASQTHTSKLSFIWENTFSNELVKYWVPNRFLILFLWMIQTSITISEETWKVRKWLQQSKWLGRRDQRPGEKVVSFLEVKWKVRKGLWEIPSFQATIQSLFSL